MNKDIKTWIAERKSEAWDKMGDTGNYDYGTYKMNWNAENYWFGQFIILEQIEDRVNSLERENKRLRRKANRLLAKCKTII